MGRDNEKNYEIATDITRNICDVIDSAIHEALHPTDGLGHTLAFGARAHLRNVIEQHLNNAREVNRLLNDSD